MPIGMSEMLRSHQLCPPLLIKQNVHNELVGQAIRGELEKNMLILLVIFLHCKLCHLHNTSEESTVEVFSIFC
jgi:hypothetical protein